MKYKKSIDEFIGTINRYDFKDCKFNEGLFLKEYAGCEIRFFKKNIETTISSLQLIYVNIFELKGYCIQYIQIHGLKHGEYNNLLNDLLMVLYSIQTFEYQKMYEFIDFMVKSLNEIKNKK